MGNLWHTHLNIAPLHGRNTHALTTPRATCTAAGGLDAETFRGLHLTGELFLLTSFFIEPNAHPSAETVRRAYPEKPRRATQSRAGQYWWSERTVSRYIAIPASPCRRSVNRKAREFVVETHLAPQIEFAPATFRLTAGEKKRVLAGQPLSAQLFSFATAIP